MAKTPEQLAKEQRILEYTNAYKGWYKNWKKDFKVPAALLDYAVKNKLSEPQFRLYCIENDKNWTKSAEANTQRAPLRTMLINLLGSRWNRDKELLKMVEAYGLIGSDEKLRRTFSLIFEKKVLTNQDFVAKNPGLATWWAKNKSSMKMENAFNPNAWISDYLADVTAQRKAFASQYATMRGGTGTLSEEMFWEAYNKGWTPDSQEFYDRVTNDPGWGTTDTAMGRKQSAINLLTSSFGDDESWRQDPNIMAIVDAFGKLKTPEEINRALTALFNEKIRNSDSFKAKNPSFESWYEHNKGTLGAFDPTSWVNGYNTNVEAARDNYSAKYREIMGSGATMSDELFWEAFNNDWDVNGVEFRDAVRGTEGWADTEGPAGRKKDFEENWQLMFNGKLSVDQALLDSYVRSEVDWNEFFQTSIKGTTWFNEQFTDYEAWEAEEAKNTGKSPAELTIFDYWASKKTKLDAETRTIVDFTNAYKEIFGADATPDISIINRAVAEKWSVGVYVGWVRKNDPNYKKSLEYTDKSRAKTADFTIWWKEMFGEGTTPDSALMQQFIDSDQTDPRGLWDQVKQTNTFQTMYPDWGVFAGGQERGGTSVVNDPMAYNRYQKEAQDAFARHGVAMPENMMRTIFASGIGTGELSSNVETYADTRRSYQWQSGQEADLATAAGVTNPTAGGDLRTRMEAALAKHKAMAGSKYNRFDTTSDNGLVTQKI
jgi:hypothetical protein